jgi:hypothetical protein
MFLALDFFNTLFIKMYRGRAVVNILVFLDIES